MSIRARLAALAVVFLAAHLPFLPPTLEDVDSINFALGVRDFDVARHQPHPPGYPVFIALAKASTAAFGAAGVPAPEARGLSIWSAVAGAALIPLLFLFFRALGDDRRAWWATLVAACAPLFWFTALRPLSDTTGLAVAVAAQALLASTIVGRTGARALIAGAFLAAVAVGVRSQTFVLTLPLLAWALAAPRASVTVRQRVMAAAAALAGGLLWAVPLIAATGGLAGYMTALGSQAGEDLSGVVILWTVRSARVAAQALVYTFLWPWGVPWLGAAVLAAAAAGALLLLWRAPRTAVLLGVAFVPYAAFHLLFHEIVTVRYALPLVVPIAYLLCVAVDAASWRPVQRWRPIKGRPTDRADEAPAAVPMPRPREGNVTRAGLACFVLPVAASTLAAAGLAQTIAPSWSYAREASPTFRAFRQLQPSETFAMHAFARRVADWEAGTLRGRALTARHGWEWLPAVEHLRTAPELTFVADPRRTDLALFDRRSLSLIGSHSWGFVEPPFVGGARPGNADLYRISSPGWMLDRGWALTAEVGGITERDGAGPHRRPSVAWIRSRPAPALAVIGGRHLGAAGDPHAEITVSTTDRRVARWIVAPGFFVERFEVPAGALQSPDAFLPLSVSSRAADGTTREIRVSLEQFDVQSDLVPMTAFEDGWYEPEYNPLTAAAWRWMSQRAVLWIRPIGRNVTLTLAGESALRYYDEAPSVRVTIGDAAVGEFRPSSDFSQEITLPHGPLAAADGRVVITSDRHFVPAEQGATPDRRRLAVRMYKVHVR